MRKVAVVGAGTMGSGIAQVMAAASFDVALIDINIDLVESGVRNIAKRFESDIKKGRISTEEKDRIMGRIQGSTDLRDASDAELVVEAIVENRVIKGELFATLNTICPGETIFATNTSTLSVTDLGTLSGRPSRFLGPHFFNPVPAMKLVEIVPGLDTATEIIDEIRAAIKSIKKIGITVRDCPGFLVNRILLAYINEALLCVQEGVSPEVIDTEARRAGFPMGPLELSDLVGWDISLHTSPVLYASYGERFPVPRLPQKLCDAGRLGVKSGKGVYTDGIVDDEFKEIVRELGVKGSKGQFSINRLIMRQVNEAIYCLQENVASPEDIDRAMVLGTGFPSKDGVGGPLHWADEKGLDWVLSVLEELSAKESATRFWPHYLLRTYTGGGRLGWKTKRGFFTYYT